MTDSVRRPQIAVCGPGDASPAALALAESVGAALARRGATLVCGGLGGCMEAACRGAKAAGGTTVGIIPGYDARAANRYVDHVVCTGMGQARNAVVAASGAAVVAIAGGAGTLSEVAMAIRLGRPVVLIGDWPAALATEIAGFASGASVRTAREPDQAVELTLKAAGKPPAR